MAYFKRFEEVLPRFGAYLSNDQLVSAYIESVYDRIRPIFRESRKDSHLIPLLELCLQAANHEDILQLRQEMEKDTTKGQGLLHRAVNFGSRSLPRKSIL